MAHKCNEAQKFVLMSIADNVLRKEGKVRRLELSADHDGLVFMSSFSARMIIL